MHPGVWYMENFQRDFSADLASGPRVAKSKKNIYNQKISIQKNFKTLEIASKRHHINIKS